MGTLRQQLGARRSRNEPEHEVVDFFDLVIHELDRPDSELNENIALDLLFLMLFASHETTSIGLTAILKFPDRQPRSIAGTNGRAREHPEKKGGSRLRRRSHMGGVQVYEVHVSCMRPAATFVIHEALRLANIAPVVFRKTTQDVQMKEYTVPQGSKVMICSAAAHLNPKVYKNPTVFNPWRWKDRTVESAGGSRISWPGLRLCVGADFAKLQMAIFLHCLVTKYRWRAISGGHNDVLPRTRVSRRFSYQASSQRLKCDN